MKRIYLSGPMTGLPALNFPAFAAMTANLRADGHTVTNPAEINPDGGSWNDCMRRDIAALMYCDTVATLPGWEHSKGARLEVLIAERLGMTIVSAHELISVEGSDQKLPQQCPGLKYKTQNYF
jgi:hypothetical protein